jgi:hypothetical protein
MEDHGQKHDRVHKKVHVRALVHVNVHDVRCNDLITLTSRALAAPTRKKSFQRLEPKWLLYQHVSRGPRHKLSWAANYTNILEQIV